MQSNLYSSINTRQACRPSSSTSRVVSRAAPCLHSGLQVASRARLQSCSTQQAKQVSGSGMQPSRHGSRVHAVQQQHDMFNDHDQPMQQHQQLIQPPEWHPRLFGLKDTKRAALEHSARLYYDEVWGHGCTDLLDELADSGVCFNDALGMDADAFSRASLKSIIQDFQASHPLLKYDLDDVLVDDSKNTVVVHYTVTAAHLLPQIDGTEATGHVSVVTGMDKMQFTRAGLISSILSFRQRFMEEEAEPINWDAV